MNELVHPDDLPLLGEALRAHIEENKPCKIEMSCRRGDGSYGYFLEKPFALGDPRTLVRKVLSE